MRENVILTFDGSRGDPAPTEEAGAPPEEGALSPGGETMDRLTFLGHREHLNWDIPPRDPLETFRDILILLIIWRLLGGC